MPLRPMPPGYDWKFGLARADNVNGREFALDERNYDRDKTCKHAFVRFLPTIHASIDEIPT
ncbi:unnamed protein product [Fusarium graminearum]|uniref:Uncharacterized protein n=1 Tax=Gibberella zeae TaxID=5518 RepID=A0A4E9E6G3_GIBZA|nr:unnamed protein product [Fusarium graminearum]CAG2006127.1 unnamed protein product [Fusarium graminearum]